MSEPKTISERYMEARNGSDILGAAGMAGHRHGMATDLWRLVHKPTPHEYKHMADQLGRKAADYMRERGLRGKPGTVAKQALAWWIKPVCRTCSGLKFAKYTDAPALSAIVCPDCNGTGIAPLKTGCNDAARHLIGQLDEAAFKASRAIKRKLR